MTPGVSFDATMAALDDIDAAIMLKGVICATRSKSAAQRPLTTSMGTEEFHEVKPWHTRA